MKFIANITLEVDEYEAESAEAAEKKLNDYIDLVVDALSKVSDVREADISWSNTDYTISEV